MRIRLLALMPAAVTLWGTPVLAQLVVGNGTTTGAEIKLFDLSGIGSPRTLVAGTPVNGITAGLDTDNVTPVLYWIKSTATRTLSKAPLSLGTGLLAPVTVIGPFTISGGLAWDSASNQLISDNASTLRTVNLTDATQTTVFTQAGLGGISYDPVGDVFYMVSNTTTALSGPGIYRITKPLSSATFTKIASLPNNNDTGITNLAFGDGRVFLTRPSATATFPRLYVYNVAAGVYEDNVPELAFTSAGGSSSGAAWIPALLTPGAATDLGVTVGASDECAVQEGGAMVFGVHIANHGAAASDPITLTVDLPSASIATFSSSVPAPTSATATQLTYSLPGLAGYGLSAYTDVRILMSAVSAGATASISATVSTMSEPNTANNTGTASTWIRPVSNASFHSAIASNNPALPTSLVPGGGGARYTTFNSPSSSPSGNWSVFRANTDAATATNHVVMRVPSGSPASIIVQKGVTSTANGIVSALPFADNVRINDLGVVAFGAADGTATTPIFIASTDGTTVTTIARKDDSIPVAPGITYGNTFGGLNALSNGQWAFCVQGNSDSQSRLLSNNGGALVAQTSATQPTGASGPLVALQISSDASLTYRSDPTGVHSIYPCTIPSASGNHFAVVADGAVVMEEGVTVLPGSSQAMTSTELLGIQVSMGSDGDWMACPPAPTPPSTVHAIARGAGTAITHVYKTGDPIFTGASEAWAQDSDPSFPRTFNHISVGAGGHYIIGGNTNAADTFANYVLVYDNQAVIARENDPIDLDGNGMFDDNAFIQSFVLSDKKVALVDNNTALVVVNLRGGESALCRVHDITTGQALIRVALPTPPSVACCRGTTCNAIAAGTCTGTVAGSASLVVASCGSGTALATCCYADFNHDGTLSIDDLFLYFNAYFTGSSWANYGGDGVAQPTIDDLFLYINAYFTGCS